MENFLLQDQNSRLKKKNNFKMGQKTNPLIWRISKTENWKSKYIEKKYNEFYLYNIKNLELKKFIITFFKNHGLSIHNCVVNYSQDSVTINITYQQSIESKFFIHKINKKQNTKILKKNKDKKRLRKETLNSLLKTIKNYYAYTTFTFKKYLIKRILYKKILQTKRITKLKYYKNYIELQKNQNIKNIQNNLFLNRLLKSILQFVGNKINVTLIFYSLNNNFKFFYNKQQHKFLKKKVAQLRRYQANNFFKQGLNQLFNCINHKHSSYLISEYISTNLKKLKRHNFFLKFIKNILNLLINTNTFLSSIKGIKIGIKGRLNGAPRAKKKIILIGDNIPLMTLKTNINYSETTSFTPNGTLGVKVWVYEKTNTKNAKRT